MFVYILIGARIVPVSEQNAEIDSLISGDFAFFGHILDGCSDKDVMVHHQI